MTFSGGYTNSDNNIHAADLTGSAFSLAPNSPELFKPDGSLNFENNTFSNPLSPSKLIARTALTNLTSSLQVSYLIAKGLTAQTTVGYLKRVFSNYTGIHKPFTDSIRPQGFGQLHICQQKLLEH